MEVIGASVMAMSVAIFDANRVEGFETLLAERLQQKGEEGTRAMLSPVT